jgi:hypothetical protein
MRNTKHDNERHEVSYVNDKQQKVIVTITDNKAAAISLIKELTAIHGNIFSMTPESSWGEFNNDD